MSDLRERLRALGLLAASSALDDLVALATKKRWGLTEILEHVADIEEKDRARRGLESRMSRSRLEKFKPMADFDWNWPTEIDRPLVESLLSLDFLEAARNVVLVAPGGLGKTMIAQNLAHRAVLAGRSALFLSAAQLLLDLGAQESARALDRRLHHYSKIGLLVIDELGFLAFDNRKKSRIVDFGAGESFDFLGYTFRWMDSEKTPGKKVVFARPRKKKRTEFLRALTATMWKCLHWPVVQVVQRIVNPRVRGWVNYFRWGNAIRDLQFVLAGRPEVRRFASRQRPKRRGGPPGPRGARTTSTARGSFSTTTVRRRAATPGCNAHRPSHGLDGNPDGGSPCPMTGAAGNSTMARLRHDASERGRSPLPRPDRARADPTARYPARRAAGFPRILLLGNTQRRA